MKNLQMGDVSDFVVAPINENLSPEERLQSCLDMSDLVMEMATYVICHVIVDYEEWLRSERGAVASAFLQRVTSTHLCNHQLTKDGIEFKYKGQVFDLHEEFKTMTLTRSVYEHLAMFYFLYEHPKSDDERTVAWNYWKINSMRNLVDLPTGDGQPVDGSKVAEEIETLRSGIFDTELGKQCRKKLDEWTNLEKPAHNGSIEFFSNQGKLDVRRVTYSQAWKVLFDNDDMTLLYRHLSMHCHPIYNGLLQYQSQAVADDGNDGVPLYLSCCFLAYLCRLFIRLVPGMKKMFDQEFNKIERSVFNALSQVPNEK